MTTETTGKRDPDELTPSEWEKKAELSLRNGDLGAAMQYAHYANVSERGESA